eukprot:2292279-Alexandrium_andersonii.AAC.1
MVTCCYRHRAMVLTISMVVGGRPKSAQTRSPELSRCPSCAAFRAEREYGNEKLPGAPQGSFCVVARAGRGG